MLSYVMGPSGVIAVVGNRPHGFRQLPLTYASYGLLVKTANFGDSDLKIFVSSDIRTGVPQRSHQRLTTVRSSSTLLQCTVLYSARANGYFRHSYDPSRVKIDGWVSFAKQLKACIERGH